MKTYSAVTTVSFSAANIAAQDFKNVYLVDSNHVSIGAAAIVKATAQSIECIDYIQWLSIYGNMYI